MEPALEAAVVVPSTLRAAPQDATFHWVLLGISAGVLLLAFVLNTRETTVVVPFLNRPLPELCTLRRLTGLSCPGCGLTRCFIALAHGDLAAAWQLNPAGIWLFAIVTAQLPWRSYQLWRLAHGQRELSFIGTGQLACGFFVALLLVQWLLRLSGVPI